MVTRLCDYVGKLGKHHNLNILVMDEDLFIYFYFICDCFDLTPHAFNCLSALSASIIIVYLAKHLKTSISTIN